MLYHDAIYGPSQIEEPVLLELLQSPALLRLQGIYQGGITGLLHIAPDFSRYDHSVGVCLLLGRLGALLAEQIAGLLHDVSHTAFSHVADFIFDRADQSYHEEIFEETLAASDVPAILARYGFEWRDWLDESRFPLLEQPLPRLCADRLDYFFRDAVPLGLATLEQVNELLNRLLVREGRIVIDGGTAAAPDLAVARWAGQTFMATDNACWSDLREVALYRLTAEAIRAGWRAGCIDEADLRSTDWLLWEKLQGCADPAVAGTLASIRPETRFVLDARRPDFSLATKIRAIDPEVAIDDQVVSLSSLDPDFSVTRAEYLARKTGNWSVRIVREE